MDIRIQLEDDGIVIIFRAFPLGWSNLPEKILPKSWLECYNPGCWSSGNWMRPKTHHNHHNKTKQTNKQNKTKQKPKSSNSGSSGDWVSLFIYLMQLFIYYYFNF